MIRETVNVRLDEAFKRKAMKKIDKTIDYVCEKSNTTLSNKEKRKIKNLSLDQVNVNVTNRTKSKTMWVFDTESYVPIVVQVQDKLSPIKDYLNKKPNAKFFHIKDNLTCSFNDKNEKEGLTKKEFEQRILEVLLEDFETASFYGTLSYVTEE